MDRTIKIENTLIGDGSPIYIIAEISANHMHKISAAKQLIGEAKNAGANAVKIQTYLPRLLTVNADIILGDDSPWKGRNLYDLYEEAHTPESWHRELFDFAHDIGITIFSTVYYPEAVDFLDELNPPAYKIASFEIVDLPLLRYVAMRGKPTILSTGMANMMEIMTAVDIFNKCKNHKLALLKCTSAYPAPLSEMNLGAIRPLKTIFDIPIGLSDHSMDIIAPVAAAALGANIIEKHLKLEETIGPDEKFSLTPTDFKKMVDAVRATEIAVGGCSIGPQPSERADIMIRKSIYIIKDMKKGDLFNKLNIRIVRPAYGVNPRYYDDIIGKRSTRDLKSGQPLKLSDVG